MMSSANLDHIKDENRSLGLSFGLLMGFFFAMGAWGIDAVEMLKTSAQLPWLRLVLGAALVIPLGGLVGWLVGKSDSAVVGLIAWLLTAILFCYWAGHVPYEIASGAIGRLIPEFAGQQVYPFNPSALTRLWIAAAVSGVLLAIGGALQTVVMDSARTTTLAARRFFIFLACVPFFVGAGVFTDLIVQRPLRQPLIVVNDLLQFALDTEGQQVDKALARSMHLGALNAIRPLLHQPRRLLMGDFDQDTLESSRVLVNFGGEWARCWVISDQPSFCQPSNNYYGEAFDCLWQVQGLGGEACKVKVEEDALTWFQSLQNQAGVSWNKPPETQVRAQYGTVTLLAVTVGQDGYDCRFQDVPKLTLQTCLPAEVLPARSSAVLQPFPTSQPEAAPTSVEVIGEQGVQQTQALLPEAQKDLQALPSLNQYDLSLQLNPDHTFQGQMDLHYTNSETDTLKSLYFRLFPNGGASYGNGSLQASDIQVDGLPAETVLSLTDSALEVSLAQPLAPGEQAQVSMRFEGVVPVDYGGEDTAAYGLYNETQDVLALAGWYPILAVYDQTGWHLNPSSFLGDSVFSDMALYNVEITASSDEVLAATGVQIDEKQEGDLVSHRYVSGPARDFFVVASPNFQLKSQVVAGTKVNSYYLKEHEPGGLQGLEVGTQAVSIYNSDFGLYPLTELDIVEAPMRNAGGVEFPGIVLIESSRYDKPNDPVFINTVAHEVAHQWWYNIIGNDVINEPWLDEGLTTYSAGVYFEGAFGTEGYQGVADYWQQSYDRVLQAGKDEAVTRSLTFFENSTNPELYGPIVYSKGALFFYYLRKEIGDKTFFMGLQAYYRQFKYQIATGKDLLKAFEDASGKDLDAFYQKWLYSPEVSG